MDLVWVKKTGGTATVIDTLKNKLSGNITFEEGDAGKKFDVYVVPVVKDTEITAENWDEPDTDICVGDINVYEKAIKTANVNNGDADTKKALSAFGAKVKDGANNGVGQNHTYYIPIFATDADGEYLESTKETDVVVSNSVHALATATFEPKNNVTLAKLMKDGAQENDVVKNWDKAYGFIKVVTNSDGMSGTATIKATLKDSNKSVSVKLNVLDEELNPSTPYAPQHVTLNGDATNTPTLSNIVAASKADASASPFVYNVTRGAGDNDGSDSYKALQKIAKDKKLKASGKITTWQYVLVNDTNLKNLKKVELGKNVVIPEITSGLDGKGSTGGKQVGFKATFADTTTAYLALAQVTYPMDVVYAAATTGDNATAEVLAQLKTGNDDITVKIASIASKTPMVTSVVPSGSEEEEEEFVTAENIDSQGATLSMTSDLGAGSVPSFEAKAISGEGAVAPDFADFGSTVFETVEGKQHVKDTYLNKTLTYKEYVLVESKDMLLADYEELSQEQEQKYVKSDGAFSVSSSNLTIPGSNSLTANKAYYLAILETKIVTPEANVEGEDTELAVTFKCTMVGTKGFKLENIVPIDVGNVSGNAEQANNDSNKAQVAYSQFADNSGWCDATAALSFVESKAALGTAYDKLSLQPSAVGGGDYLNVFYNGDSNQATNETKYLYLVKTVNEVSTLITEKLFKVTITAYTPG
jgi:hypothetical protein